jgi:DNA-binding beta-propeller fold protein YncE
MKPLTLPFVSIFASLVVAASAGSAPAHSKAEIHYHEIERFSVPGDGGWDYIAIDSKRHRLFISHGAVTTVMDVQTKQLAGVIPDTAGVHGIAIAQSLNRGFTSNGRDNSVTAFDLTTLKTIAKYPISGQNPDCIMYEPVTQRVFTFNGRSSNATAIDAMTGKVLGTIPLDGKPEFAQPDGKGSIFNNIEDKSEIERIDARTLKVTGKWSIAPGEGPSGLAIDAAHRRAFSVTDGKMIISDIDAGKVVATAEVGEGPDATNYDPKLKLAFSSNGESATLTIVKEETPDKFAVLENVKTEPGARTMTLDPVTHRVYLVTAKIVPPTPGAAAGGRHGRQTAPGSFMVLVYGP